MHLNHVPASEGFQWVKRSIRTFLKKPKALMGLVLLFMMWVVGMYFVPYVGVILSMFMMPIATAGQLLACKQVEQGQLQFPQVLLAGFTGSRQARDSLLQLGVFYTVFSLVMMVLQSYAMDLPIAEMMGWTAPSADEPITRNGNYGLVFVLNMVGVFCGLMFTLAAGLVQRHNLPPTKALFFGVTGVAKNVGAVAVFFLTFMGLILVASTVLVLLGIMVMPASGIPADASLSALVLVGVVSTLLLLVILSVSFASWHHILEGCFRDGADSADGAV